MNFLDNMNFDWIDFLNFYNRPFRAKFIPKKVFKDLDRYCNDSKGLSNYMKKWRTRVEFKTKGRWKHAAVGGAYEPEERQCVIIVHTRTEFEDHVFTEKTWYRFKRMVVQTLMHEFIHFMQFDRRNDNWAYYFMPYKKTANFKLNLEREYLCNFDEIQAYAHDVYLECMISRTNIDCVADIIPEVSKKRTRCPSMSLRYYLKTFDFSPKEHAPLPKLFDQVKKWERKYTKYIKRNCC